MAKTQISVSMAGSIIKALRQIKQPKSFTKKEFLESKEMVNEISELRKKGFTDDEIIETVIQVAKVNGFEGELRYSKKEINSVLENLPKEVESKLNDKNKQTENDN